MTLRNRPAPRILRNQTGFTLIEIIAVLVILGILAVVALPKFADMQTESRTKTMEGIAASALSQLSMNYSTLLLRGNSVAVAANCADVTISDNSYTLTCTGGMGNSVTVTVTHSPTSSTVTRTWVSPSN